MIHDVIIKPLLRIPDERGCIMRMLRADDPEFEQFGEVYFSFAYPGVIKGWHYHKVATQNYAVIAGMIKLVLYDDRPGSSTRGELQEIFLGEQYYCLVRIPPCIWNGYKTISSQPTIVANCSTIPHDTDEMVRLDPLDPTIPYNWDLKHR